MTSATVQHQAILAFDSLADQYDDIFTHSRIGRAQRATVWKVLTQTFKPGDHILEINCGTGEDALFLSQNAISVVACDASERMIQKARQRLGYESPDAQIRLEILATEALSELKVARLFDGAFSNFSGLNCVKDLRTTAHYLAMLVSVGSPLIICLSTRFCISEICWFAFHGKFLRAVRRCTGHATVTVNEFKVMVQYPTVRELKRLFSPYFRIRSYTGVGVTVPPSYLEPWVRKHPKIFRLLCLVDEIVSSVPVFRTVGDHVLICFERVEA
jgi:SAM-dependent methyltransferase